MKRLMSVEWWKKVSANAVKKMFQTGVTLLVTQLNSGVVEWREVCNAVIAVGIISFATSLAALLE